MARESPMARFENYGKRCDGCGALLTTEKPTVICAADWRTGDLRAGCVSRYHWPPANWTFGKVSEWPGEYPTARPFYIAVAMNRDGSTVANPGVPYPATAPRPR